MTDTEFVVVENLASTDTNAVILKVWLEIILTQEGYFSVHIEISTENMYVKLMCYINFVFFCMFPCKTEKKTVVFVVKLKFFLACAKENEIYCLTTLFTYYTA